jgi:hypothetical protein
MLLKVLVESGVVPAEEVAAHSGRPALSALLTHELLTGAAGEAGGGRAARGDSGPRAVRVSRDGKQMPVFREKRQEAIVQEQDSDSDSSSDSDSDSESDVAHSNGKGNVGRSGVGISATLTKKCLIFAQHRSVLDIIESLVFKRNFPFVPYRRLDGSIPPKDRFDVTEEFSNGQQNSTALRVLLMTTRSCGLGLNLQAADTVIFVEMDWNPFVDAQAMDRAHRIGQTRPVTVFRLIADSTIEARIMTLQSRKEAVAAEIINEDNEGTSGSANSVSDPYNSTVWNTLSSVSSINNPPCPSIHDSNSSAQTQYLDSGPDYECFSVNEFMRNFGGEM